MFPSPLSGASFYFFSFLPSVDVSDRLALQNTVPNRPEKSKGCHDRACRMDGLTLLNFEN